MTATGFIAGEVTGYGKVEYVDAGTVRPDPALPVEQRLRRLYVSTQTYLTLARGRSSPAPDLYAAVEDVAFEAWAGKAFRKPSTITTLGSAWGAIVAALAEGLEPGHLTVVKREDYYPRFKGRWMAKESAAAMGRKLLPQPLCTSSEHVCMAALMMDWWSRNTGARILHYADRRGPSPLLSVAP